MLQKITKYYKELLLLNDVHGNYKLICLVDMPVDKFFCVSVIVTVVKANRKITLNNKKSIISPKQNLCQSPVLKTFLFV